MPDISEEELVGRLRSAGYAGVFLFGGPERTIPTQRDNIRYVYPFADVPRDPETRELILDETTVPYLEEQLNMGVVRGIGEISLRHRPFPQSPPEGDQNPADGPVPLEIYDLAARWNIPVCVHVEHEYSDELERALQHNRNTIIIWAHAGDAQPLLVEEMMRNHPNLYIDLSSRNPFYSRGIPIGEQSLTDEDGILKESWRSLFEAYPDRCLAGLDITGYDRLQYVEDLYSYNIAWLRQVSEEARIQIGSGNSRWLLGLTAVRAYQ